jgi:crossover junction endodeoxyribonuclease RuvC
MRGENSKKHYPAAFPNTYTESVMDAPNGCQRVLGVDPAAAGATGYGVVEFAGREARVLDAGALQLPPRAPQALRLREIHRRISRLLEEFAPQAIAVESVFAALNPRSALLLAEVRGVVLLAAAQASIPAHSYSPREVKLKVAGYGNASKEQVQRMVKALLRLAELPEPADAADALAVALCHAYTAEAKARLGAAVVEARTGRTSRPAAQPAKRSGRRTGASR